LIIFWRRKPTLSYLLHGLVPDTTYVDFRLNVG
jgi:hypothetical protein